MNEMTMLTDHHAAQPAPSPATMAAARARLAARIEPRQRRTRLRRRYAFAAAGVAATVTAGVFAPSLIDHSAQAYAVERAPGGAIKVTIREFANPDGLQRKLRSMGARVAVSYLPLLEDCANGPRGRVVEGAPADVIQDMVPTPARRIGDETFLIHPDRIRPGQTLVWELGVELRQLDHKAVPDRRYSVAIRQAAYLVWGAVRPCVPVHPR